MEEYMLSKILVLCVFLSGANAFAFPFPPAPYQKSSQQFATNYHFDGIVALSNCSGSIIQFEGAKPTDQAIILTNGHCYEGGMPSPGEIIYHHKSNARFEVLDDHSNGIGTLHAEEVIYATMTKTDMSLYRVKETYQFIEQKWGAHTLILSSKHPKANTPIEVISGYWHRGYSCKIDGFAYQLNEGGWKFDDSIRYSKPGCEIIGGTSGSPIIEAGTRNVIGVNNTMNEGGRTCSQNNPCEIDHNGKMSNQKGNGYGQQTYWIYSCLNASLEFDLKTPGCVLPQ